MTVVADTITDIIFTLNASSAPNGSKLMTFPIMRKRGVPGGWGIPRITEHAMNSPQSQKDTEGAIVIK